MHAMHCYTTIIKSINISVEHEQINEISALKLSGSLLEGFCQLLTNKAKVSYQFSHENVQW